MDPIIRVGSLVTFSFLESLIYPNLTDESVRGMSVEYLQNKRKVMLPLIKLLELDKIETVEEIRKKLYVDFGTLMDAIPKDKEMQAKVLLNVYEDEIHSNKNLREGVETLHVSDHAKYDLEKFNYGIVALGVDNFMAAAAQFCEEEAARGAIDIVSVGSGDGTIERAIMAEYRSRYGKDLSRIKLVDPDPAFEGVVDFKTVDHLIEERPNMVGNCVAFIIWPLPQGQGLMAADGHEPYDVEAIRKLKPSAVFVVYETAGTSGSYDFRTSLRDEKLDNLSPEEIGVLNWLNRAFPPKKKTYGLDNYKIIEIAHQKIWFPRSGTYIFRMVKLKRVGRNSDDTNGTRKEEKV